MNHQQHCTGKAKTVRQTSTVTDIADDRHVDSADDTQIESASSDKAEVEDEDSSDEGQVEDEASSGEAQVEDECDTPLSEKGHDVSFKE